MIRWLTGAVLLLASVSATACPLCLAFTLEITAQDIVAADRAVLALPEDAGRRWRIVEVIRGRERPGSTIAAGAIMKLDASSAAGSKALLLLRQEKWALWANFGAIDATRAPWLRRLAAGKRAADMSQADWEAQAASMLPYLEDPEPLVADIAYGEIASAPYAAQRALRPGLDKVALRRWLDEPRLAHRRSLYTLLLGIAGDEFDAARLEARINAAWKSKDATNLGPMLAAALELRGASRMAWIDDRYLRQHDRTTAELEAALLALGVQGDADATIPRERVIRSYRLFMKHHPALAGFVAHDLAEWRYWDAGPEFRALLKSNVDQHPASRIAIMAYLQQSPRGAEGP